VSADNPKERDDFDTMPAIAATAADSKNFLREKDEIDDIVPLLSDEIRGLVHAGKGY
jgi:hypothetical protein